MPRGPSPDAAVVDFTRFAIVHTRVSRASAPADLSRVVTCGKSKVALTGSSEDLSKHVGHEHGLTAWSGEGADVTGTAVIRAAKSSLTSG
jgi:hypothetical protein